jgi:hypothetical protein
MADLRLGVIEGYLPILQITRFVFIGLKLCCAYFVCYGKKTREGCGIQQLRTSNLHQSHDYWVTRIKCFPVTRVS